MDLELWHLILLPVLFAAGWISRGVEKRQNEAEVTQTPEAYSQGVTLLLAGKEDKAIDCFIEAVRLEPERTDLHFILGRLFRGRGEFARAIRVHESLMNNADLPTEDRVEAIRALAEDFMTAGLFDRAEETYRMLADIPDTHLDALRALLRIYIIEHEWTAAIDTARALEKEAEEDRSQEISHYYLELADTALRQKRLDFADECVDEALRTVAHSPRAWVTRGVIALSAGDAAKAEAAWRRLLEFAPEYVPLVAGRLADAMVAQGKKEEALDFLVRCGNDPAATDAVDEILTRIGKLAGDEKARVFAEEILKAHPTLATYGAYLKGATGASPNEEMTKMLSGMMQRYAKRFSRYQCKKCGFLASSFAWGCLGCGAWDSFPPRKIDEA